MRSRSIKRIDFLHRDGCEQAQALAAWTARDARRATEVLLAAPSQA
jgi:hypothetical protein